MLLVLAGPAHAGHVANVRTDRSDIVYAVNPDQTYTETVTVDRTLLTTRGIQSHDRSAMSFYPDQQTLEVLEAWVDQPDGTRLQVGPESRFTRPSASSQSAPGFTGSLTTTIVYPQLRPGSRTHIKFRRVQTACRCWVSTPGRKPSWKTLRRRTGWKSISRRRCPKVEKSRRRDGHRCHGRRSPADRGRNGADQGQAPERGAVDSSDFQPIFLATTLPDLETVGAIYYRQSQGRAVVTPEIAALAARIAGEATGLAAAKAIYDWVTVNIRYIAVYLNPNDGWVPHAAADVLKNGYGDCKDQRC